jgi:hypothetical protein
MPFGAVRLAAPLMFGRDVRSMMEVGPARPLDHAQAEK